ncbi:thioredoxin family protein [Primorskyibacter sp. 2E107]|uniref:thioredoxin family protein n=1 Tax=Primorskyibacter sp. 2E107 TaxID=3403458 RepID=UPI003AF9151F
MTDLKLVCLDCGQTNRIPAQKLGLSAKCGTCGAGLIGSKPKDVDTSTLAKAVQTDGLPLLVDFWAPWCAPCRTMAPEFFKAADILQNRIRLVKVNTQDHPDAGQRYAIRGIPTMILFATGKEKARHSGAIPAAEIVEFASRVMGKA